ncbi:MAG: NADH-quinone oxidoreductase subunit M [Nitrospirae bacterium]|nr:NADH-quinone oxidoreductase subunit M [Nitrospirota bacterium]
MILGWLIIILLISGLAAWYSERFNPVWPRVISLISLIFVFALVLLLWMQLPSRTVPMKTMWLVEMNKEWIPQLGVRFHLALDGLSLPLIMLTLFLGIMSVGISWTEIKERVGFFHLNLLWILAGIIGVFTALDLFLFYFFWELMLVPMYFLIALWGHENRRYASFKFFLFTQLSGLLMLISIIGLYFIHGHNTGVYTFNYMDLLGTSLTSSEAAWLMLGFFIAFAVKLPAVPFHTWLPDAHTEAPTAGSVILAGLLLKTGAYGLIRFVVPLFPQAAFDFAPAAITLGFIGILYGAVLAFSQTDLKRLVAYTSVSHMGFVLLGIFAWNELALQGALMQMICHGIATGALFMIAGALQERIHTRDMERMGGLWTVAPRMGAVALFFALASLGLPGLGNFVGEFLVLLGSYQKSAVMTVLATTGIIIATVYALWIIQRAFHGEQREKLKIHDFSIREMLLMSVMIFPLVWLGLYPQPVFEKSRDAFHHLLNAQSEQRLRDNKIEVTKIRGFEVEKKMKNAKEAVDGSL